MREKLITTAVIALAAAATVWGTEYELKWDTGEVGATLVCINVGAGFWYANDFDVSTLEARHIYSLKIMCAPAGTWDGFRIAFFDFDGAPGNIIWPTSGVPKLVKGSGQGMFVWCEFDIGWTLPDGTTAFAAGQEQFFLPPYCDPYCFDDDVENRWHTWHKGPKDPWRLHSSSRKDKNLMLRVILSGDVAIHPTSLGRVKALYR